jgi:8-oxo-dGTP pyrophosphatase MutT (NUDIX family)
MRGESIQHALHREIEEETGLSDVVVDTKYLMTVSPLRIPNTDQSSKSSFGLVLSVYHCKLNGVADITLSDEHQGYDWVDSDKLVDRLKVKYNTNFLEQLINQIAN